VRLQGKTAFITGAGSGMGRLAAQLFAREGAEIVAIDITEGPLKETVSSVEVEGGSIIGVPADITVSESVGPSGS